MRPDPTADGSKLYSGVLIALPVYSSHFDTNFKKLFVIDGHTVHGLAVKTDISARKV